MNIQSVTVSYKYIYILNFIKAFLKTYFRFKRGTSELHLDEGCEQSHSKRHTLLSVWGLSPSRAETHPPPPTHARMTHVGTTFCPARRKPRAHQAGREDGAGRRGTGAHRPRGHYPACTGHAHLRRRHPWPPVCHKTAGTEATRLAEPQVLIT